MDIKAAKVITSGLSRRYINFAWKQEFSRGSYLQCSARHLGHSSRLLSQISLLKEMVKVKMTVENNTTFEL